MKIENIKVGTRYHIRNTTSDLNETYQGFVVSKGDDCVIVEDEQSQFVEMAEDIIAPTPDQGPLRRKKWLGLF